MMTLKNIDANDSKLNRLAFYDPQNSPTHSSFENQFPIAELEQLQRHIQARYNEHINERYNNSNNKPMHGRVQALKSTANEMVDRNNNRVENPSENRMQKRPFQENPTTKPKNEISTKQTECSNPLDTSKKPAIIDQDCRRVTPTIHQRPTLGFHSNFNKEQKFNQAKQAYLAFLEARKQSKKDTNSLNSDDEFDSTEEEQDKPKFGDDSDDGLIFQLEL